MPPPVKLKRKKVLPDAATNDKSSKTKTDSTGKPAPLPVENITPMQPVKARPSAETLLAAWRNSWLKATPTAGGGWTDALDPLKANVLHREHQPIARLADYLPVPDGRETVTSFYWGSGLFRELANYASRLLATAERTWAQAFKRGKTDPHGRLSSGPSGDLLVFARWQRRCEAAADLAAGHWNPESSLTPSGPEPPRFKDPTGAAAAVFEAGAMIRALEAACIEYPHLGVSPYPEALMPLVEQAEDRVRADLKLAAGILSSLRDTREWKALLDLDPAAVEADPTTAQRVFWRSSSAAREAALRVAGAALYVISPDSQWSGAGDPSMGLGERDPKGAWMRPGTCWWEAVDMAERGHNWQQACRQRDELEKRIEALVDDPSKPTAIRQQNLTHKLGMEKQLQLREREIETLATEMLAEPEEKRNGTD